MLQDLILSFRDNFRQKTANPFFGTLIIVWLVRNWEAIYSLFTFEKEKTLANRIWTLQDYFQPEGFFINLFYCVCISLLVLIATYFLLNLSRLIINYFEKKVTPWVYQITDKNSVVLKTDYEKLYTELRELEKRLTLEREARIQAQNDRDELENKIINKKNINNTSEDNDSINQTFSSTDVGHVIENFNTKNQFQKFDEILNIILDNEATKETEFLRELIHKGIIKRGRINNEGLYRYTLTPFGEKIKSRYNLYYK